MRSPNLELFKLAYLRDVSPANKCQLLEFAGVVATSSSCLHTLHIQDTRTSAETGDIFMQVLADSKME